MAAKKKFVLEQGSTLRGLGRSVLAAVKQSVTGPPDRSPEEAVGTTARLTVEPPSRELVEAYIAHVGGDPANYRDHIPPHLFPQWTFDAATQTLVETPYPLVRAMNGGCRMEVDGRLPYDEEFQVTATLADIDDNGRRAVLHQELVTETAGNPRAVVGHMYVVVPLKSSKDGSKTEKPTVPDSAREVQRWSLKSNAGLDFAILTGDFNLIHWIPPLAKASGFDNTILHGFSTFARSCESLRHRVLDDGEQLDVVDVQFTRPLVLPADVGFYVEDNQMWVADAVGERPYMSGEFERGARG